MINKFKNKVSCTVVLENCDKLLILIVILILWLSESEKVTRKTAYIPFFHIYAFQVQFSHIKQWNMVMNIYQIFFKLSFELNITKVKHFPWPSHPLNAVYSTAYGTFSCSKYILKQLKLFIFSRREICFVEFATVRWGANNVKIIRR